MQAHPENTEPVYHLFVVTVDDPEHFLAYMQERGIDITVTIRCRVIYKRHMKI